VSKQPLLKVAAVQVRKVAAAGGALAPAPTTTASRPLADIGRRTQGDGAARAGDDRPMKIGLAIRDVRAAEGELIAALEWIGERHRTDHDVFHLSRTLIGVHEGNLEALAPFAERYGAGQAEVSGGHPEEGGLLEDLRHVHLRYAQASIDWVLLSQGAKAIRDAELVDAAARCHAQTLRGLKWTVTRLKSAAPQVLAG
jgi:hypothetical protein